MARTTDAREKPSHAADTITRQHEELRVLMASLPGTRDLALLVARLRELRDGLEGHFELEEGPAGFHHIVLDRAPRHHTRVQRLFDEHRELLRRIAVLESQARACLDGPAGEVFREAEAITEALSRHEEHENDMLDDAMYSDTGFGD